MKLCWTNIRLSARKESVNFCSTDFFYFLSGKQIMSQFDAKWPEVSCNPVHYFFLLFRLIWWLCYAQILTECIIKLTDSGFFSITVIHPANFTLTQHFDSNSLFTLLRAKIEFKKKSIFPRLKFESMSILKYFL